jgi:AraC-like DNA-binding protein
MFSAMGVYRPPPPLSSSVGFLWESGSYVRPHRTERVLPTGAIDLVIDLAPDGRDHGAVSGARSTFSLLDTSRRREFIGARFKIGGGFIFFGPAGALRDLRIPVEMLWGRAALELRERLVAVPPGAARFALLQRFLLHRLDRDQRPHPAVRHALWCLRRSQGSASIGVLADECGLSRRRFIEIFRDQVGLTPKLFARLLRFRRSLAAIGASQEVDWADLAAGCGYSDQPHFIHDFRRFTGLTPSVYLRHRTTHVNHLRDPG